MSTEYHNCKIISLYNRVPNNFNKSWKIDISFKEKDDDLFPKFKTITIDQDKFKDDILNKKYNKKRLYYTDSMGDIDIFKQGDEYCIMYSPHETIYIDFYFSKEEFEQLYNWLNIEYNK